MREILFRGKITENGKWIEGQYIHLHKTTYCFKEDYDTALDNDIHQIVFEQMTDWGLPNNHLRTDIDPATLGQYTGLTDINGVKVYEGDIIKCYTGRICKVTFFTAPSYSGFDLTAIGNLNKPAPHRWMLFKDMEVIGNIYDNPELLGE